MWNDDDVVLWVEQYLSDDNDDDGDDDDDEDDDDDYDDDRCLPVTTVTAPPKSLSRINFEILAKNSRHAMYSDPRT